MLNLKVQSTTRTHAADLRVTDIQHCFYGSLCGTDKNVDGIGTLNTHKVQFSLYLVSTLSAHAHIKKGKAVPLQAWSGPEGSRKLRFPDFMTTAQEGSKVVTLTHQSHLPPGNIPGTHFC